ncbi:MAG: hypothetical protein K6E81_06970 [Lachnospiraceae bacterium]|nr:hypothetical protein [Lachnospiraceae bacterium]
MIQNFDEAMTGITEEMIPDPELRELYQQLVRMRGEEDFVFEEISPESHIPGGKLIKKISKGLTGWMLKPIVLQMRRNRLLQEDFNFYVLEYIRKHVTEGAVDSKAGEGGRA